MLRQHIARLLAQLTAGAAPDQRLDAGETATFTRALQHVQAQVFNVLYSPLKSRMFIPKGESPHNGADTFVWHSWSLIGMAKIITNYADDLPSSSAFATEHTTPFRSLGASYHYSIQDIRRAAKSGSPLNAQKAVAARESIENAIDEVLAIGNAAHALPGMLTNDNVPDVAADTGSWTASTAALLILRDVNKLIATVGIQSLQRHAATAVLFPPSMFELLSTPMTADNTQTILQVLKAQHPGVQFDQWWRLETAGTDAGPMLVAYERSTRVLEAVISQEFEQFAPQLMNLAIKIPCHARVGGTVVHYPLGMAYMSLTA
jgi:hypothetical protein